jgi:hypothetical protein
VVQVCDAVVALAYQVVFRDLWNHD